MAGEQPKNSVNGTNGNNDAANRSNMIRSMLFTVVLICFVAMLVVNWTNRGVSKTEVPISEVITRANNPDGDISKITVTGDSLDITLKGKDQPTETSRKTVQGLCMIRGWWTIVRI